MTPLDVAPTAVAPDPVPSTPGGAGRTRGPQLAATAAAVLVLAAAVLVLGPLGLLPLGLLLALSTGDGEGVRRLVGYDRSNLVLLAVVPVGLAVLWLAQHELAGPILVLLAGALITLPLCLRESLGAGGVPVSRRDLVLAVWSVVVVGFVYADRGVWLFALAALCVLVPLVLAVSRARAARFGRVQTGLLRHPLRRDLRSHLAQAVNIWVMCVLLGALLAAGGAQHARILFSLTAAQLDALTVTLSAGLVLLAALALVPLRRVRVTTNVLVALLSGFLVLQLAAVSLPPPAATVLDSPFADGDWFVFNAGRSVLLNGHSPNEGNAIDFMRLGANGRTHTGGSQAPLAAYAGFGARLLAPADGRVAGMTDSHADNTPGTSGHLANHLVLDIGGGRFVLMGHLQQDSVTVGVGDTVRRGQPVAKVGNSGHSNEPHLHLQVQDSPAGIDAERTYPMVFRSLDITRGGLWPWGEDSELRLGDQVRATR